MRFSKRLNSKTSACISAERYARIPHSTLDVGAGSHIESTLREAKEIAQDRVRAGRYNDGEIVVFVFNDVVVHVGPDSDLSLIQRDWNRAMNDYIPKIVGPDAKVELSAVELAQDAEIEAVNQARRDESSARYRAEAEAEEKHNRVTALMANAPAMEFSNEEVWHTAKDANQDDYGAGIISYAERWARMMQLKMSEGGTLSDIWGDTSFEADLEGMSGFSQSAATHLLTESWVHGAELRRLHNAEYGVMNDSGTVNSALFTLEVKE